MYKISIAKDYTEYPGGRYTTDGKFSGEDFRDTILIPMIKKHQLVEVDLNGTAGYGSSFLEEAFGGLIRNGFTHDEVAEQVRINTNRPGLKEEVLTYIKGANK